METINWNDEYNKLTNSAIQLHTKYTQTKYTLDKVKEYIETYYSYNRFTGECTQRHDFDSSNAKAIIKMIDKEMY